MLTGAISHIAVLGSLNMYLLTLFPRTSVLSCFDHTECSTSCSPRYLGRHHHYRSVIESLLNTRYSQHFSLSFPHPQMTLDVDAIRTQISTHLRSRSVQLSNFPQGSEHLGKHILHIRSIAQAFLNIGVILVIIENRRQYERIGRLPYQRFAPKIS